jgi:hypothetical protein
LLLTRPLPHIDKSRQPSQGQAMTIGVGYLGTDWIFLGSDMELTGVAKYPGLKDYFKWFDEQKGLAAAVYSGIEDDMRCVWEELGKRIQLKENSGIKLEPNDVRAILSESLTLVITDPKSQFQMLVAITKPAHQPVFLKVFRKRISPATSWEVIGADCELTRYLISFMRADPTKYQALLWGTHIVNTACSFAQYVGQGIRLSIVKDGRVEYVDGDIFSRKLSTMDAYIGGLWFDFCNAEMPQQEFEARLQAFTSSILTLRGGIPKILTS